MTQRLTPTTKHPDYQGTPIAFSPALLRQFEERLVVAEKCGYDQITFEDHVVLLEYGIALATVIREKFCAVYGKKFVNWVVGPKPTFTVTVDAAVLQHISLETQLLGSHGPAAPEHSA